MADKPKQHFTIQSNEGENVVFIYTENVKAINASKILTQGAYYKGGKLFAYSFSCIENDDLHKKLVGILGLTEADEKKPPRLKRRTKAEMEEARAKGEK